MCDDGSCPLPPPCSRCGNNSAAYEVAYGHSDGTKLCAKCEYETTGSCAVTQNEAGEWVRVFDHDTPVPIDELPSHLRPPLQEASDG